jgi:twitching motility protein PilT
MTKRLLPDPDLEALIQRLNDTAKETPDADESVEAEPAPPSSPTGPSAESRFCLPTSTSEGLDWLNRLLEEARRRDASDLLLVVGAAPVVRVHGKLRAIGGETLGPGATGTLCAALVPRARRPGLERDGAVDFAIGKSGVGRFRCNVHREREHWSAAVRLLPDRAPELEALHLPPEVARFAELEHGLVLVTGPTGSGKSTTMASMVRRILARRSVHLITIEDPVEYSHPHGGSVVEHVEIGRDTDTFARALRSALRQDPDVLLIGEMRDAASISIAITAAETGHLVLATLHTGDAPQTIHRILDSYPSSQIETVRVQLSISLAGIISQQLLPNKGGHGRVPAVEVMVATNAVRNLIRQGKVAQLKSQIVLEKAAGMLSLDRSLADLVAADLIDRAEARPRARDVGEFDAFLRRC